MNSSLSPPIVTPPYTDTGSPSIAFLTVSGALVFIMTPGLGLFYSGLVRSKFALSTLLTSFLSIAVITFEWFLWGFSLSFSESSDNAFIGNFNHAFLMNVNSGSFQTAPQVPAIVYCFYQLMFAIITPAIVFGAVAERVRLLPSMVFIFWWSTLVYNFAAFWTWSYRGWLKNLDCLETTRGTPCAQGVYGLSFLLLPDFAGGGPVHMASGFAALAFAIFMGQRKKSSTNPHSLPLVYLGTALLAFGWIGFNAGSAVASTTRAAMAGMVTIICASISALSWMLFDYITNKKYSGVGFCTGAITGLVIITPSSGYVSPWASFVIAIIGTALVYPFVYFRERLGYDDVLDAFPIHGVGGFVGNILTGIFHQKWVAALDGTVTNAGAIDGFAKSIGYQLAGSVSISAWSFVVTFGLLFLISKIPGLNFHFDESQVEPVGADLLEMNERAYSLTEEKQAILSEGSQEAV